MENVNEKLKQKEKEVTELAREIWLRMCSSPITATSGHGMPSYAFEKAEEFLEEKAKRYPNGKMDVHIVGVKNDNS